MKIYEVVVWDSGDPMTFYEPTKQAALARKQQMLAEDPSYEFVDINTISVEPTRQGIAEAMQWVIDRLCANEH